MQLNEEKTGNETVCLSTASVCNSVNLMKKESDDSSDQKKLEENLLINRSTSYFVFRTESMNKDSKNKVDETRSIRKQKSISELCINDIPSLRSTEIIKNIISSSREAQSNALKTISSTKLNAEKTMTNNQTKVEQSKASKLVDMNENKNSTKDRLLHRISSPPIINFSTWNDRPKVEVSVMNDYTISKNFTINNREQPKIMDMLEKNRGKVIFKTEQILPKVIKVSIISLKHTSK